MEVLGYTHTRVFIVRKLQDTIMSFLPVTRNDLLAAAIFKSVVIITCRLAKKDVYQYIMYQCLTFHKSIKKVQDELSTFL